MLTLLVKKSTMKNSWVSIFYNTRKNFKSNLILVVVLTRILRSLVITVTTIVLTLASPLVTTMATITFVTVTTTMSIMTIIAVIPTLAKC